MHCSVYERQKKKEKKKKNKNKNKNKKKKKNKKGENKRTAILSNSEKGMDAHKHPSSLVAPTAAASSANGLHVVLFISKKGKGGWRDYGEKKKEQQHHPMETVEETAGQCVTIMPDKSARPHSAA